MLLYLHKEIYYGFKEKKYHLKHLSSALNKFSPVPMFTIGMSKKNVPAFFEISSKTLTKMAKHFSAPVTSVITFITKDRKRLFFAHLYNFVLKTVLLLS